MYTFSSVFQIVCELLFFCTYLNYINSKTNFYKKSSVVRYCIISIIIISKIPIFSFTYDIVSYIIYYLYLVFLSKQTFLKKTWLYIKFMFASHLAYFIIKLFILRFFDWSSLSTNPLYDDIKNTFIYLIIYIFCRLIYTPLTPPKKKKRKGMPFYKNLLLALFILPTILLCVAVYLFNTNASSINTTILIFVLIVVSILTFILLLFTSINFLHQEQQRHLLEQLLQQREMNLAYYEDVSNAMLQISRLRHDFKNHLILICDYIRRHEYLLAIEYIQRIIKLSHAPIEEVFTNSTAVSAVLNVKSMKCKEANISLDLDLSFPQIYQLKDIDIVTILGNLLDNAITATSALEEEKRMIALSIRQVDTYLDITCKNSFNGVVDLDEQGFLKSTKKNRRNEHGIGILNIKHTISPYSGEFNMYYDDRIFTVHILVPNHE